MNLNDGVELLLLMEVLVRKRVIHVVLRRNHRLNARTMLRAMLNDLLAAAAESV